MRLVLHSSNRHFVHLFRCLLERDQIDVLHVEDHAGLEQALQTKDCLGLIMDMPDEAEEGWRYWQSIRQRTSLPVMTISSAASDVERVLNMQQAAFYISKPIANMFRQLKEPQGKDLITLSPEVVFDVANHCIWRGGERESLSCIQFKLLYLLATNRTKFFDVEELITNLWDGDDEAFHSNLYFHIRKLREKIEADPHYPRLLVTERGKGYCLREWEEDLRKN